jgi:hypothetical protein
VVPKVAVHERRSTDGTEQILQSVYTRDIETRGANEECALGNFGLANLWQATLRQEGWRQAEIEGYLGSWAPSTLQTYDRVVRKLRDFCTSQQMPFPPKRTDS